MKVDLNTPIRLEDYVQTRTPNKPELSRLLQEAKGPDRNMAVFAKECGSSPSTFSRILNCKISQPIEPSLLETIANHCCSKNVEERHFMLLSLLHANGMVDKDFIEKKSSDPFMGSFFSSDEELFSKENETKNVITMNLLNRGLGIRYIATIKKDTGVNDVARGFGRTEFVIQIDGQTPEYHRFQVVCLDRMVRTVRAMGSEESCDYGLEANRLFREEAVYFLLDAWEPETFEKVKSSFVFNDQKYYEAYKEKLRGAKVNSWISLVLVDLEKQSVEEEYYLQRNDCRKRTSLFDLPVITSNWGEEDTE